MITIKKLRHLIAVNIHGSFSKAALHENITQSALSKSISDIEEALGKPVFHRTATGTLSTELGQEFINRAARVLADMDALFSDLISHGDTFRDHLRITFAPAAVEGLLGQSVLNFFRKYPSVILDLMPSPISDVGLVLLRGDADIAIGVRSLLSGWTDLDVFPLIKHRFVLFAKRDHPLSQQDKVGGDDLTQYPLILPPHAANYSPLLAQLSPALRISTMNHFPTIQNIVRATNSVSIVFQEYTQSNEFNRYFAAISNLELGIDGDLYYAHVARRPIKSAARAFVEFVRTF